MGRLSRSKERLRRWVSESFPGSVARHYDEPREVCARHASERPRQPFNREDALRFPLNAASHDVGLRYFFDFTIAASALDLQPGARVLDLAAGSCYASELLNRLGYTTVAYDYDRAILGVGRERLGMDARSVSENALFACGDGTVLPFADESFDGVLCLNSLHHMPSYRLTLEELHRVLRPGSRAAFSEPGSQHASSPQSVAMRAQYGVLERDVCIDDIARLAREVGFVRVVLRPFPYPELIDLPFDELKVLRKGRNVSVRALSPAGLAEFFERQHTLFFLEKAGERRLTSASARPDLLRAELTVTSCPSVVVRGREICARVRCRNTGRSIWISRPSALGRHVTLGVKILGEDGLVVDDTRGRTVLCRDVDPGGEIELDVRLSMDDLAEGRYTLLFDMVHERVCWFEFVGSDAVRVGVRLGASLPRS